MGKSLLDDDFLEFEGDDTTDIADDGDDVVEKHPKKSTAAKEEIEVEVVDDTPEGDRGKWVADDLKDGEPDLPNEDEVRSYSKDVKKRISQMTARVHAERRAKDEMSRQFAELTEFAKNILNENNQLKNVLENGEKALVGEHKGRLEAQMAQAKRQLAEAQEAGDNAAFAAATEQLSRLAAQLDRVSMHRPAPLQKADVEEFSKKYTVQDKTERQDNSRANDWARKNPWYNNDIPMTSYAIGVHQHLVQREGITPDQDEYWSRIDSEMKSRFPDRFKPDQRRGKPVVVAGVSRGTSGSPTKKVVLTESQARIARRLGLTVEQYASQVNAERNNEGNMFEHGRAK